MTDPRFAIANPGAEPSDEAVEALARLLAAIARRESNRKGPADDTREAQCVTDERQGVTAHGCYDKPRKSGK